MCQRTHRGICSFHHFSSTPRRLDEATRSIWPKSPYFDWQVGQLLSLLEKHELSDDTLVMVVSEQGNSFPFAKWTCYEMGLQSGMIVRWPGKVTAGTTTDAMVEYVDVVPTFLAAAGAAEPYGLDGRSFLRVLTGDESTHKEFVYGLHTTRGIINGSPSYGIRSIRSQAFRYILNLTPEATFQNAVFQKKNKWWKSWEEKAATGDPHAQAMVAKYRKRPGEELYDVRSDPLNMTNLAEKSEFAATKAQLRERLDAWMSAQGDEGQATELAAHERQWGKRNKKQ